jgi:phospholipid/cholesterol/gamma-HCH transport system permease protein
MDKVPSTKIGDAATNDAVFYLQGRIDRSQAGAIWRRLARPLRTQKPSTVTLDLREVTGIDTAGIALLISLENLCSSQGTELILRNLPDTVKPFLSYVKERSSGQPTPKVRPWIDPISRLGDWGLKQLQDAYAFIRFLGDFLMAGPVQLTHPRRLHVRELLYQTQQVGAGAVPLLVMLSLLLGALLVFQGMTTVRNFGQDIYIADLVIFAVTREMAPLLTAVVLAGRTGAAFAAEIGTMKLNEEIDALTVHNFDITRYLALPRIFAITLAGPLLTMISDAAGILGGLVTSEAVLHLPVASFLQEAQKVFKPSDIYTGLIKGFKPEWMPAVWAFKPLRQWLPASLW